MYYYVIYRGIKMVKRTKETLQEIKLLQANDYEIKDETAEYVLMEKKTSSFLGHLLLFVFFWWTLGVVNLLYWLLSKKTKKILK